MNWKKAIAASLLTGLGAGAKTFGDVKAKQAELELGIGKPDWQTKFEAYKSMSPEDRSLYIEQKDSLPGAFSYNQTLDPKQKEEFKTFNKRDPVNNGGGGKQTQGEYDRETNEALSAVNSGTADQKTYNRAIKGYNGMGLEDQAKAQAQFPGVFKK